MFKYLKILAILFLLTTSCKKNVNQNPNVLLIMVDDLNDYTEIFKGHPQIKTPIL